LGWEVEDDGVLPESEIRRTSRRPASKQRRPASKQGRPNRPPTRARTEARAAEREAQRLRKEELRRERAAQKEQLRGERAAAKLAQSEKRQRLAQARAAEREAQRLRKEELRRERAAQKEQLRGERAAEREARLLQRAEIRKARRLRSREEKAHEVDLRRELKANRKAANQAARQQRIANRLDEKKSRIRLTKSPRQPIDTSDQKPVQPETTEALALPNGAVEAYLEEPETVPDDALPEMEIAHVAIPEVTASEIAQPVIAERATVAMVPDGLRVTHPAAWEIAASVAQAAIVLALLLLIFLVYEFWWTSTETAGSQHRLLTQFEAELRHQNQLDSRGGSSAPILGLLPPSGGAEPSPSVPLAQLTIPAIDASYIVVQGISPTDLALGPGHYPLTALPGQLGNVVIAGHRATFLHPFYYLNELRPGDRIEMLTTQHRIIYSVRRTMIVSPRDADVLAPTPYPRLTLITANPVDGSSTRLVVVANALSVDNVPIQYLNIKDEQRGAVIHDHWQLAGEHSSLAPVEFWAAVILVLNLLTRIAARRLRWLPVYAVAFSLIIVSGIMLMGAISTALPACF